MLQLGINICDICPRSSTLEELLPSAGIEDSNDIYARGSPLKVKESKLQASLASCNQQMLPDLALT